MIYSSSSNIFDSPNEINRMSQEKSYSSGSHKRSRLVRTLSQELENIITLDEIKEDISCWKKLLETFWKKRESGLCLAQPKDQRLLSTIRKKGLDRLDLYLSNLTRREVLMLDMKLLTWCCLGLLAFYHQRNRDRGRCFKNQKFNLSRDLFHNTIYLIVPDKEKEVIKYCILYFNITRQWHLEEFAAFIFEELLKIVSQPEIVLAKLIKQIVYNRRDGSAENAQKITASLAVILERTYWDNYLFNHRLHNCLNEMLKLYLLEGVSQSSFTLKLRMEIKNCLRNFISNMRDNKGLVSVMDSVAKCLFDVTISDEDRMELCDVMAFCAQRHHVTLYRESITPDLLNFLLNTLRSRDRNLVMVCHKILHILLDRRGNLRYFAEPVYFFRGRFDFNVNVNCDTEDVQFFKNCSQKLYDGILSSFTHCMEVANLTMCYMTICLILVEVPEPVITINMIHIIIGTQTTILKTGKTVSFAAKAHIHSIIASILSLICVIHQDEAEPLRKYVDEVVSFRTENAPHLLPPLYLKYSVASHHTTDYHDQLYFLEEEILYALQRCWLGRRQTGSQRKSVSKTPGPRSSIAE